MFDQKEDNNASDSDGDLESPKSSINSNQGAEHFHSYSPPEEDEGEEPASGWEDCVQEEEWEEFLRKEGKKINIPEGDEVDLVEELITHSLGLPKPYCPLINPRALSRDPIFNTLLTYYLRIALRRSRRLDYITHLAVADSDSDDENLSPQTPTTRLQDGNWSGDASVASLNEPPSSVREKLAQLTHTLSTSSQSSHSINGEPSTVFNATIHSGAQPPLASLSLQDRSTNPNTLRRAFLLMQLKLEMQTVTSLIWPLAFTITTLHDLIHYDRYPKDRYGYSLESTLFGFAPVEAAWNNHFGGDLPNDPRYYFAWVALWAPFLIFSMIPLLRHCGPNVSLKKLSENPRYSHKFLPWNDHSYAIVKDTFKLLLDKQQPSIKKNDIFQYLITTIESHSGLPYYQAIRALAEIVDKIPTETSNAKRLQWDALGRLTSIANAKNYRLRRLFATYQLWTLNRLPAPKRGHEALFWLTSVLIGYPLTLLSAFYAIRLMIFKSKGLHTYLNDKQACEAEDKIFRCLDQISACICAVCADWAEGLSTDRDTPSVHYTRSDDAQVCLDALLSEKRTPDGLLTTLTHFLHRTHTNIMAFDASLQETFSWTESEWDKLLSLLERHQPELKIFNLSYSRPGGTPIPFSLSHLTRLRLFLSRMHIAQFSLAGQNLAAAGFAHLVEGLSNLSWTTLDVSRNELGNAGISTLAALLPNLPTLSTLRLSENKMTDGGAYSLFYALNQSAEPLNTLTYLDLSNNLAGGTNLAQLLTVFYNRSLTSLFLSRLPLTQPVFTALSPLLWSQLKQLSVAGASVTDIRLEALLPNNTTDCQDADYDFSHNPFGDVGVEYLLAALSNRYNCSAGTTLSLGYTQITDASLPTIALFLTEKNIVGLTLGRTLITSTGLLSALPDFCHPDVFLSEFSLTDMPLSDAVASQLADLLKNSTCRERLTALDLSNTRLTRFGASEIFSALLGTQLQKLTLANNPLAGEDALWRNQTPDSYPLSVLDLSNAELDGRDLHQLLMFMTQAPNLTEFTLNNNPLGPGAGTQFAEMLLTPTPPHVGQLTHSQIPRDLSRLLSDQSPFKYVSVEPSTKLEKLGLENTGSDTHDARALCRVSYSAGFFAPNLNLRNNPYVDTRFVNPHTCEIASPPGNMLFLSTLILLGFCWLLPCLFRTGATLASKCSDANPSQFFSRSAARRSAEDHNNDYQEMKDPPTPSARR